MASSITRHVLRTSRNLFCRSLSGIVVPKTSNACLSKLPASTCCAQNIQKRQFSRSSISCCQEEEGEEEKAASPQIRPVHDVETSIRYIESKAYNITYGEEPVWVPYRRNHKGLFPPEKTRRNCIKFGAVSTGNPCPICRDEYLVLHPKNKKLLEQFINPYSGEVLSFKKTGVCQKQQKNILIAVEKAWDMGYIEKPIPYKEYDYSDYYPQLKTS